MLIPHFTSGTVSLGWSEVCTTEQASRMGQESRLYFYVVKI